MHPLALAFALLAASDPRLEWLQWGGPTRDFQLPAAHIADAWPASGPKQLWKRPLGDGYSSIVTDGSTLYTLYKQGTVGTVAVALGAKSGATKWEQRFDSTPTKEELKEIDTVHGYAPASTPIIAGDRLIIVTYYGQLVALDRATGKVLWLEDLWHKHNGTFVEYGYTSSPLLYKDTIIIPVGGNGTAMMAFRLRDGSVAWKGGDSPNGTSSPRLITVDGQEQVVTMMLKEVISVDPATGELLWRYPHTNRTDTNVTDPVWCPGNILLLSSAYGAGTRALHLKRDSNKTNVTELWLNSRIRVHFGNVIQIGDLAYASSGDFGASPLTAFKIATGEIVWQQRFAKSSFLKVDSRIIILDEEGKLSLSTLAPDGLKVMSQSERLTNPAWTPPTLSGTTLYIRDRKSIEALELR